jgi:plastocyanin
MRPAGGTVGRMRRAWLVVVAGVVVAGCGGDDDAAAPVQGCRDGTGGAVTVVAEDLAWDAACIDAIAGESLTITVDNRDDGVNHNLHLPDAPGSPTTELAAGPGTQELVVSLPEGDYEFVCDIHPNMVGTLAVTDANPADP